MAKRFWVMMLCLNFLVHDGAADAFQENWRARSRRLVIFPQDLQALRGGMGRSSESHAKMRDRTTEEKQARPKDVEMMEVRHILVEKYSKALEVLEVLASGEIMFNEAARQFSIDKAGRCGLLGWKRRSELDQDFWAAALLVPEGKYTVAPIKTQYGYHIIKVEGRK